jgi:uncharacterized protein (DUF58 family)
LLQITVYKPRPIEGRITSMKSLIFLLFLLLLLSPTYARKPSAARARRSENLKFGPRKIQERFYNHNQTPKVMTVKKAETWPFSIRTVIPGSLILDVKENRADYEYSVGPLVRTFLVETKKRPMFFDPS